MTARGFRRPRCASRERASILILAALAAGCASPQDSAACQAAPDELVRQIQEHIEVGGLVRNVVAVAAPNGTGYFVSFENRTEKQVDTDAKGHILTVSTSELEGGELRAVDEWAQKETDLPRSETDLRQEGAVESRGCVAARRATPAPVEPSS